MAQRLFWLFRVVTSLFIGAVLLGECEAQLPQAVPLSHPVWGLRVPSGQPLPQGGLPHPAHMRPSLWHVPSLLPLLRGVWALGNHAGPISPTFITFLFRGKQIKMNVCGEKAFGYWREEMEGEGPLALL